MSYQVLARKWRPRNFKTMVGQEHIVRMLTNALEQNRLHHAYLFTGTRGVGKTTFGRILTKCLNCETGVTPSPCDQCATCKAIDAGQFLDLYEVDAASRTKVEDTRELLDNVLYAPTQGRYKVYLIDEVHMLSNHSFNALLKTLEEPPAHVIFILATTDPKRLPITILSRCLQFYLKRISPDQIAQHLQYICQQENINGEPQALDKLAKAAEGSMRDALSLLDQAIAYGHGNVKDAEVTAMLGCMAQDDIVPLIEALATQDGQRLFDISAHLTERAPDYQQILEELISLLHHIAVIQIVPNALTSTATIAALATQIAPEDVQLYYQIALLGRRDISLSPSPQQGFEMTLLRMLAFKPSAAKVSASAIPSAATKPLAITKADTKATPTTQSTEWRDLLPKLELTGMAYALAANCTLEKISETAISLALSANHEPMLNPKLQERIAEALTRHLKRPIQLSIHITTAEIVTPIKQKQHEQKQHLDSATQSIMQDPKVKQLIDMYDATVNVSLID